MVERKLTTKQQKFVDNYVKLGNATEAMKAAGYSEKAAASMAACNMNKPHIREAINKRLKEMADATIADAKEVMQYLTSVMRGESQSSEVVVEGLGEGVSEAREFYKKPSEQDRLKAATLLAKRFGLTTSEAETKIKLDYMKLENDKLKLEIERLRGGSDEEINDGFIEALSGTAAEDWSDE